MLYERSCEHAIYFLLQMHKSVFASGEIHAESKERDLSAALLILSLFSFHCKNTTHFNSIISETNKGFFLSHPARPRSVATAALLGPVSYTVFI